MLEFARTEEDVHFLRIEQFVAMVSWPPMLGLLLVYGCYVPGIHTCMSLSGRISCQTYETSRYPRNVFSCPKLSSLPPQSPPETITVVTFYKLSHRTARIKFPHPRTIKYYSLYSVWSLSLTLVETLKLLILDNNV
jgi:hypothetical protein